MGKKKVKVKAPKFVTLIETWGNRRIVRRLSVAEIEQSRLDLVTINRREMKELLMTTQLGGKKS